ncbi:MULTISPECIES: uroporphyrinogen-III synthase [unclassified Caulobacter]|uniref:uroporphyrinogen-III synthase n=1 Tax=unclassified Caulobacter TaxID=2648921 RepID=UPI0006F6F1C3|nr:MULTISPECIES: uroporphyrinogen-III synthase [unclassified Caulobacter]KQV62265.1 uroporphyrinogen III synthase [Caulobacter sp. Root342]KQV63185.1 uroporphyrinogen III synthase [Caulobacter sp. Root343]
MGEGAPVWITRARPGALATADRVAALGFTPLVDPLLTVEALDVEFDLSHVAALAFTSLNGVEAFARLSDVRGLPVFAVGRATAKAAEAAGFASVVSADGDVEDLGRLIASSASGLVVWAGAKEPAGDLVGLLRGHGVMARDVAVYETTERAPSAGTLAHLDGPLTALLHSPRAARALATILRERPAPGLRALCLSEAVAAPLVGLKELGSVAFAPRPDESALLDMLSA